MMFSPSQLKNASGKFITKSLFYELSYIEPKYSIFTLKDYDMEFEGKALVSFPKLYLSIVSNDPTEYEFSQVVFGSWEHWQAIAKSPFVKPYINKLRKEVEVKVKSEAIKAIAEEMKSNGRSSFSAAKLLLEKGWLDKDTASKAKQKLAAKEQQEQDKEALALLSEDAERLGIKIQ
jgi:hypothetical protein